MAHDRIQITSLPGFGSCPALGCHLQPWQLWRPWWERTACLPPSVRSRQEAVLPACAHPVLSLLDFTSVLKGDQPSGQGSLYSP
jgi:hypothetical protein